MTAARPGNAASARRQRMAVVGGGWAGLSAAVHATAAGLDVTVFEMARQWGGRARSRADDGLDNGQHILLGACSATLALMRRVGVDPEQALLRQPLALCRPDGRGLRLSSGPAAWAFTHAVLRCTAWTLSERLRLLARCARWLAAGLRSEPDRSVQALCDGLPQAVRKLLIDPLCVAALNTPVDEASAAVFLRVLRDGLFGGPGASDLLLPRRPLQELLPAPATRWLDQHGTTLHAGQRVMEIVATPSGFAVDGVAFDGVVLACPAGEAARLVQDLAPQWSAQAKALRFEPIVTVHVQAAGLQPLPLPMLALQESDEAPAQYVFDHGRLGSPPGRLAFVISGAGVWVERGLAATTAAVLAQAAGELGRFGWQAGHTKVLATIAERRATFRSTPGLQRPRALIVPGLFAAGDYVDGPYPATLEGAVRAGAFAAAACTTAMQNTVSPPRTMP